MTSAWAVANADNPFKCSMAIFRGVLRRRNTVSTQSAAGDKTAASETSGKLGASMRTTSKRSRAFARKLLIRALDNNSGGATPPESIAQYWPDEEETAR